MFELAALVEAHGDQLSPTEWSARFAYLQTEFLRWTAAFGMNTHMAEAAHDNIGELIRYHPDGGLPHDLGDLSPDGAAQIAASAAHGPATLIPPGWNLNGWDHERTRTHPILA
ncbi:hypothetical protein E1264_20125, partial [Actinomadura sp. KC216]|uniref:hypothetical protein n=1 Tax=Actinomadura sp. KC216 TaxID=2530370 RepID=UPI00104E1D03